MRGGIETFAKTSLEGGKGAELGGSVNEGKKSGFKDPSKARCKRDGSRGRRSERVRFFWYRSDLGDVPLGRCVRCERAQSKE